MCILNTWYLGHLGRIRCYIQPIFFIPDTRPFCILVYYKKKKKKLISVFHGVLDFRALPQTQRGKNVHALLKV